MLGGHEHLEYMGDVRGIGVALRLGIHRGMEVLSPPGNPDLSEEITFGLASTRRSGGVVDGLYHALNYKQGYAHSTGQIGLIVSAHDMLDAGLSLYKTSR
eukprot:14143286-Heterocapsa_arctica.AAC.1